MLAEGALPSSKFDPIYYYSMLNFTGDSFLVHADVLLYNAYQYTHRDLSIYLALASLRSYGEYKASGTLTLELLKSPVHPHEYLENPRLLRIHKDNIIFPYEEIPNKKEQH